MLEPILRARRRLDGKGRPPQDPREVLNGVLRMLGTGAQWRELPREYPPYQTCQRRFQQWVRSGKLQKALRKLARRLRDECRLNLEEAFIDAAFVAAGKGAARPRPTRRGQGTKIKTATGWMSRCASSTASR